MPDQASLPTLRQAREQGIETLGDAEHCRLDVDVLLMHCCHLDRAALWSRDRQQLTASQLDEFRRLLQQRHQGQPIAYLTGDKEFWSLPIRVTTRTLIPRPETELLVERALQRIDPQQAVTVADLGTGSGNIAAAIATERPHSQLVAIDSDPDALAVARENFETLGLAHVSVRQGQWCAPLGEEQMDVVVSNPPYIAERDPHLDQGDVAFEPRSALVAGDDGLSDIRAIIEQVRNCLRPGGWLLLEHGYDQETAVAGLLQQQGYSDIHCYRDLSGQPRVTEGRIS